VSSAGPARWGAAPIDVASPAGINLRLETADRNRNPPPNGGGNAGSDRRRTFIFIR
jgi:hypothetical protein